MIFEELDINENNINNIIFSKVFLKSGAELTNIRGIGITEHNVIFASKISGTTANQLIVARSEICAIEYGEVKFNKKNYYY